MPGRFARGPAIRRTAMNFGELFVLLVVVAVPVVCAAVWKSRGKSNVLGKPLER